MADKNHSDSRADVSTDTIDQLTTTVSTAYKVLGKFSDTSGAGVLGHNTASTGTAYGVEGVTDSSEDRAAGVRGEATAAGTSGGTVGVHGVSNTDGDFTTATVPAGVLGEATGKAPTDGVRGVAPNGAGVSGFGNWGLFTPDTARLEGLLDTGETDFVVEAGTTATNDATNVLTSSPP
jgi:hypothetical protein